VIIKKTGIHFAGKNAQFLSIYMATVLL